MSVELKKKQDVSIPVSEMRDGQIGVITNIKMNNSIKLGLLVQKGGNRLLVIGKNEYWSDCYDDLELRVKILKNGTELIIKDNE